MKSIPEHNDLYSELEDLIFEQWRRERTEQLAMEQQLLIELAGKGMKVDLNGVMIDRENEDRSGSFCEE